MFPTVNLLPLLNHWSGFWRRHPALLLGVFGLLITSIFLTGHPIFCFPLAILLLPLCGLFNGIAFCSGLLVFFHLISPIPSLPIEQKVEGTFYPKGVKSKRTSFGPKWEYQGTLTLSDSTSYPIKFTIPFRYNNTKPDADTVYYVRGLLKKGTSGLFFIPEKNFSWVPIKPLTFGFSEWRYHAKQWLKKKIQTRFTSEKAARFLEGISTGDFQDFVMSQEFGRFGLQHIMAVSGFHFSIITAIMSWIVLGFAGRKFGAALLLIGLLGYFIFLGGTPSILRAWIAASLMLLGVLFDYKIKSLNALGIGLLAVIIGDVTAIQNLGFQFSFAITASILLFTSYFEGLLSEIYPTRTLHRAVELKIHEKWGYLFLQWIKKGIALTLSVNICAFPMALFIFGKFPLWSLFYNLFFPLMVALSIFLLVFGITLGLCFELWGFAPNSLNNWYTDAMLNLAYNFPYQWDLYFETNLITTPIIVIYMSLLFSIGAFVYKK